VLEHGRLRRAFLGIAGQAVILPESQQSLADGPEALLVVAVTEGSPAAGAGLFVGDVLLAVNGQAVHSSEDLLDLLAGAELGRPTPLRVLRGTSVLELTATLAERP
jgi:S1-C subfamily serine protease